MEDNPASSFQIIHENVDQDVNMPEVVAGMEMLAVNAMTEESESSLNINGRILRKRRPKLLEDSTLNRRCSLRPKKRALVDNDKEIKKVYLSTSVKRKSNCLETIFEESEDSNENNIYMSAKRFKRALQFEVEPTDSKIKKRREKIRKLDGSKIRKHKRNARGKLPMQALLEKLKRAHMDIPIATRGNGDSPLENCT